MSAERDIHRSRAYQVGMLMRAYRESFAVGRGRRGLTQEELLRKMGEVDPQYSQRFSHATVSRWESGATRLTVDRLQTFGKALNLSEDEVNGLLLLAGLATQDPGDGEMSASGGASADRRSANNLELDREGASSLAGVRGEWMSGLFGEVFRFFAVRFLLPGALIAGFHYLLSLLGWDNAWMPVISVALAFLVVLGQGFIFPDRSAGLRDFFSISIFFVLTTPLLQYSRLGMDHYNFHLVPGFESTMMPYLLTLMVNLGLAWSAGLIFHVLRRWRYQEDIPSMGSVARAASVTLPPLGVVYAVVMVITNFSVAVQLAVVFAVLPLAFSLLLFLQESSSGLDDQDRRVLFQVLVTAACVSIAVGVAVIMSIYLSPDFPSVLPDHNLVRSWDLDFGALGFTREEALDRVNLGYTWHAIFLLIYMSCVVGGRLFVEIHRLGKAGDVAGASSRRRSTRSSTRPPAGGQGMSFFIPRPLAQGQIRNGTGRGSGVSGWRPWR